MSAVRSLHELRQVLEHLGPWRERLAGRLIDAADRLDAPGEPPADELIDDLDAYRTQTLQLAEDLELAGSLSDEGVAAGITLSELALRLGERERRERVVPVLADILSLRHIEAADFEPLANCHAEARRLLALPMRSGDATVDAGLDAIYRSSHPLNFLLKLCQKGDGLSDSDWVECNDQVTAAYGRQLATALARGRIQRVVDAASAATETVPSATPTQNNAVAVQPAPKDPSLIVMALPPALPAAIETITARSPAPPSMRPMADSIFEPSPMAECVFEEQTPPPKLPGLPPSISEPRHIDQSVVLAPWSDFANPQPESVVPSVESTDIHTASFAVSQRVVQLLTDDRLPLAMHVARCAEFRLGLPVPFPPVWLLRSLILGEHLSDSKGELARQIDDDLRNFRPEMLTEGNADIRLATGFLLRAAALPAALISGSAPATAILRAFRITSGCSQLYNYCSRITHYGDRLDGQIVEFFRPQSNEAVDVDTGSLGEEAAQWLQEAARNAIHYQRTSLLFLHAHWTLTAGTSIQYPEATQIWCKWQETLLQASRLLRPVCHNLPGERHWVRQEIVRLSASLRLEPNDGAQRNGGSHGTPARSNALPTDEMQAVLRKAIELAGRWLRLSGSMSAHPTGSLSLDVFDLRDEVLERTAGVLNELGEQWQAESSPLVRVGIACCRRSVERIHALFEGGRSLPLKELDLRHALHAELLKIPGLELNDQWLPEADPVTLERELSEHLQRGDASWRQAYDMQALNGDHVATGRLLELDVWSSEAERDELLTQRNAQITEHRLALARELNEVAADLQATGRLGQLDDADADVAAQRLERLRRDLPRLLNFGSCRWQLDQMRSALQRRRPRPVSTDLSTHPDWSPASPDRRRVQLLSAAASDRADESDSRETVAAANHIFF